MKSKLCSLKYELNGYSDLDEIPHKAAFHQGIHCLLK